MPYYVVRHARGMDLESAMLFHKKEDAVAFADKRHEATGRHYHVIKTDTVWTTKTLDEALKEEQ